MNRAQRTVGLLLGASLAIAASWTMSPPPVTATPAPALVGADWLRVDPAHPNILLMGSDGWMWRSTDSGNTWRDNASALGEFYGLACGGSLSSCLGGPPQFSVDGSEVYVTEYQSGEAPSSFAVPSLASSDGGAHWSAIGSATQSNGYGEGDFGIVTSPLSGTVAYAIYQAGQSTATWPEITTDGGAHWLGWNVDSSTYPPDGARVNSVIASSSDPHSYYANVGPFQNVGPFNSAVPGYTIRVSRDGAAVARMPSPTGKGFTGFMVEQDLPGGAGLVGLVTGPHAPADRRYLSQDGGKTWHVGVCPGDLQGGCPTSVLVNVFGAGRRFVVNRVGIFPFTGAQSVGPRLPISGNLPLKNGIQLVDVDAGVRVGAPAYLLTADSAHGGANILYRTTDGGHSWQRVVLTATVHK